MPVVVEATRDTPTYYINHAQITFGEHEIALVLARIPTRPSREEMQEAEELGSLTIDPELQVILPPTLVPRLIDALGQIQAAYGEAVGKPIRNENVAT